MSEEVALKPSSQFTPLGPWREVMHDLGHRTPYPTRPELHRESELWLFAFTGTFVADATLPDLKRMRGWASDPGSGGVVMLLVPGSREAVVRVEPYLLAVTEITIAQWYALGGERGLVDSVTGNDRNPITDVSWDEVTTRCEHVGLRLPKELEWELACRAGTTTAFWFGGDEFSEGEVPPGLSEELERYAWFAANAGTRTHPVAQKPANPWGFFDVHGNVDEWCQDESDGGGSSYRVVRGGSWSRAAHGCRCAFRTYWPPVNRYAYLGFRPASSLLR